MIYLWFFIPLILGLLLVYFEFRFGLGIDTTNWDLIPTLRCGKNDEGHYYLATDFLCVTLSFGLRLKKEKETI